MSTFTRVFTKTTSIIDKKAMEPIALCLTAFIPLIAMAQSLATMV